MRKFFHAYLPIENVWMSAGSEFENFQHQVIATLP